MLRYDIYIEDLSMDYIMYRLNGGTETEEDGYNLEVGQ